MRSQLSVLTLLLAAAACSERNISGPDSPTANPVSFSRAGSPDDDHAANVGGVFTETDDPTSNAVVAFGRRPDGTLQYLGNFATGGQGLGGNNVADPLASQFAVLLSPDHRYLFAVNAKSNSVAAFAVKKSGLTAIGTYASNGVKPVSLAATNHVLYVLNQGSNTITGFRIDDGQLRYEPELTRSLSANAQGGAAIRFDHGSHLLAVTERLSGTIDVFEVRHDVLARTPVQTPSNGAGPFGFDWTPRNQLVASEAANGSVSSYSASRNGSLVTDTKSISTHQAAPCWLITTHDGRFAYAANAGSGSVTGFAIDAGGTLAILNGNGVTGVLGAGTTPLDLDVSQDSKFLYVLKAGVNTVGAFVVSNTGALASLPDGVGGLPTRSGQMGLAAY
jgi:6-phosphogluconolactonase (cycloisomerase 2 family)